MRGYACIALDNPKAPQNVGQVLRAAFCMGAAQITISGDRGAGTFNKWVRSAPNTTKTERHCPVFITDDPLAYRPIGAEVVAVDIVEGATDLRAFRHPQRAIYVFGAEDATLEKRILDRAQHKLVIPTAHCLNLAAAVSVVLYDRIAKGAPMLDAYEAPDYSHMYARRQCHSKPA